MRRKIPGTEIDEEEPSVVGPSFEDAAAAGGAEDGGGPAASLVASDPYARSQWHIVNPSYGIDVQAVWDDYAGRGVKVGIIDDGFQYTHPDLDGNYRTDLDYDTRDRDSDAFASAADDRHGTAVAGTIGAEINNGVGGAGVAWDADLVGLRIGYGSAGSTSQVLDAFTRAAALDVVNNSWGYGGYFGDNFASAAFSSIAGAVQNAAAAGRGGLGTVTVFSAGNDRAAGNDVNYHDFQNSPYAIAVGATDSAGKIASFSTPGAALLVSAPGVGIVTTDRTGGDGYVSGDVVSVSGTSFSAPIVSGVVALMLEANPNLGYRDVQEILAYSAERTAPFNAGAKANGATDWNGGGLTFNRDYGFGQVDAHAAVRLAESWDLQSTYANMAKLSASAAPNLAINSNQTITSSIKVGAAGIEIDRVEVSVDIRHTWIGDLSVSLISPSGTESLLVNRPGVSSTSARGASQDNIIFTMDSTQFWGENPTGTWTLKVTDAAAGDVGRLVSWKLDFLGDAPTANDLYVYTDAFAALGASAGRATLRDLDGGIDTMNLAAIKSAVSINLNAGQASSVLGRSLTIAAGTVIENVVTGDGADTIRGNAADNRIAGGRGADQVWGGLGSDVFVFDRLADRGDSIRDFNAAQDRFDLSGLLADYGYLGTTPFQEGWVRFAAAGADTLLQLDPDAAASNAALVTIATLSGVTGLGAGDYLFV